jgi:hypothetical protein
MYRQWLYSRGSKTLDKDFCMPKTRKNKSTFNHNQLHKCPTGIQGFDQLTEGGLPKNRTK